MSIPSMDDNDWRNLLDRIGKGLCTPFLGAGVNGNALPLGGEIARRWASDEGYPLEDCWDLPRVAQFVAVKHDPMKPKEMIAAEFEGKEPPDLRVKAQPLGVLAELPLPVYLTTNYDDFLAQALLKQGKEPKRELCRWNSLLRKQPSVLTRLSRYQPTPANPLVFHLHGCLEVLESLVLTEDDYIDFLVNITKDPHVLPPRIQEALTRSSLLFIGYRLADINFRVVHRGLVQAMERSLRRLSVSVQFPKPGPGAQEYFNKYFGEMDVKVYWGSAEEFVAELSDRWRLTHGRTALPAP